MPASTRSSASRKGLGAFAGERDGHAGLEEAQGVALGNIQLGARRGQCGRDGDPQIAEFGQKIGIEGFGVADHADEARGAVVQHPLGVGQGGDAADGGQAGFARFGKGGLVAALDVRGHGDQRRDQKPAAAIDLVGLSGNGNGGERGRRRGCGRRPSRRWSW